MANGRLRPPSAAPDSRVRPTDTTVEAGFRRSWRRRVEVGACPWPTERDSPPSPAEVCSWMRRFLPKRFKLLSWYRLVIHELYSRERPLEAIASIARGNGKTTLAAGLSVYELFGRGRPEAQVLHLATTQMQARLCYDLAVRMVEEVPALFSRAQVVWVGGCERLMVPALGAFMVALPTKNERSLQGYTPSLAIVDEVGFVGDESWSAMAQATVKQEDAQVLGIGTPGWDETGLMYRLRTLNRERPTPRFRFLEWAAPEDAELDDRKGWRKANPALGAVKSESAMAHLLHTSTEHDFRTFQLGQWVGRASSWFPPGVWSALGTVEPPPEGAEVVLGFDGSASRDSTALTWAAQGAVGLVEAWERTEEPGWKVEREAVLDVIHWAFAHWNVRALVADPWGWRSELEQLERQYGADKVITFPTDSWPRMAPAVDRFQVAVLSGSLAHDHHPVLARHVQQAAVRRSLQGSMIHKPDETHKIDAAVAAVVAYNHLMAVPAPEPRQYSRRLVL